MRGTQGCTHTSRSVLISFDSLAANVISSVATGLLTALISVRLALRRFRSERLWDRRVQAYSNLFEALFHVKAYTKRALDRIEGGGDLNDDYMKELAARSGEGYREIRKAVVIGVLALGPEAVKRLESLEADFDDPHHNMDLHEEISADLDAVTRAIDDLRPIAKRDLQIS